MANFIFPKYLKAACSGGVNTDLLSGNVKAMLIDIDDDVITTADEFKSDVIGAAVVNESPNLANKTLSDLAAFDCDNFVFAGVSGDEFEAVVFFIDTGVDATSRLVCYLDTSQGGLPLTPDGSDVTFEVDSAGIFGL